MNKSDYDQLAIAKYVVLHRGETARCVGDCFDVGGCKDKVCIFEDFCDRDGDEGIIEKKLQTAKDFIEEHKKLKFLQEL